MRKYFALFLFLACTISIYSADQVTVEFNGGISNTVLKKKMETNHKRFFKKGNRMIILNFGHFLLSER